MAPMDVDPDVRDDRRERAIRLMLMGEDGLMEDFTSREFGMHRVVR